MSFWDKNLKAIEKRDHDLFEKIENYSREEDKGTLQFVIEQARDNSDILGIIKDGRKTMLNSTYRPKDEAEKFAGKIQMTENSVTVLVGLGNGEIASKIIEKINDEANLFIYEPSTELFFYVMEHFDIVHLIEDKRVALFIEGLDEDILANNISYILTSANIGVSVLEAHPKYRELFPEQYQKAEKIFKDCKDSELTSIRTKIYRGKFMTQNAIANIPYLLKSKLSSDYIGKFPKEMPAIIVSGGPSLDKNYEVLKQAKGKALIIAMDRTAKFLLDRGIEPDMFCSLDYNKNPKLFEDERLKDIPFVYMPDLSHRVMQIVNGNKLIYGTGDFKFYDSLIEQYGKKPIIIPVGGSVATFAYGFARSMGFKKTILVGQDLALTDGKIYSGGQVKTRAEAAQFEHMMVPGNIEETVETRGDFYVYLQWFNRAVKEAEGKMEVINATEGGARIEGTKIMTLQEAVDRYCTKEYKIKQIFEAEDYIFPQDNLEKVYEILEKRGMEIQKLKMMAKTLQNYQKMCSTYRTWRFRQGV